MTHTTVEVESLPECDLCIEPAKYDAKTFHGPWANLCEAHFHTHGIGLGLGKGQLLVVRNSKDA